MRDVVRGANTGTEPVTVAELKANGRIDGTTDDTLLSGFITAARSEVEEFTRRMLIRGAVVYHIRGGDLPRFLDGVTLPWVPVIALTAVSYIQTSTGTTVSLSLSDFVLRAFDDAAFVVPAAGKAWPFDASQLMIAYTCGYAAADIPAPLKQSILWRASQFNANREGGVPISDDAVTAALLGPWRVRQFG